MPTVRKIVNPAAGTNDERQMTTNGHVVMAGESAYAPSEIVYGSNLPSGWVKAKFEQLVRFSQNGISKRSSNIGSATVVLRLADIVEGSISLDDTRRISLTKEEIQKYQLARDDLLCIRVNGSPNLVGRLLRAGEFREAIAFCDHFIRFQVISSGVSAAYIAWYFTADAVRRYIELNKVSSAGQNTVSQGTIGDIDVLLPPLAEQRRIVEAIEQQLTRLDAGVASLKRTQAGLRRYKAAVLKAACEGRLVPQDASDEPVDALLRRILDERRLKWEAEQIAKMQAQGRMVLDDGWRAKYQEPRGPDMAGLSELPHGWVWATVDQLAAHEPSAVTDGPFGSNLKTEHYTELGPRVIRLQNIGDGEFVNAEAHISQQHFETLQRHRVFAGDLVIAALGETLPRACIIPEALGSAIVKADCIRFKPHTGLAIVKYLNAALNSDVLKRAAARIIHGIGRPRLNQQEIKSLPIPLPSLAEQQRIVAEVERRLSVVAEVEAAVAANLKRAERLRQAILKRAFEGKLVPQDPSDEPASVLLERIRRERDGETTRRKAKQLRMEGM